MVFSEVGCEEKSGGRTSMDRVFDDAVSRHLLHRHGDLLEMDSVEIHPLAGVYNALFSGCSIPLRLYVSWQGSSRGILADSVSDHDRGFTKNARALAFPFKIALIATILATKSLCTYRSRKIVARSRENDAIMSWLFAGKKAIQHTLYNHA